MEIKFNNHSFFAADDDTFVFIYNNEEYINNQSDKTTFYLWNDHIRSMNVGFMMFELYKYTWNYEIQSIYFNKNLKYEDQNITSRSQRNYFLLGSQSY